MEVRDLILQTAFKGFVEHGFDNVSLNELIKRTGLTKGAFYYYFKNKKELLREIHERYLYQYVDRSIEELSSVEGTMTQKLESIADSIIRMHLNVFNEADMDLNPKKIFLLFQNGTEKDPELQKREKKRNDKIIAILINIIKTGKKENEIRNDVDPAMIAEMISLLVDGVRSKWLISSDELEPLLKTNLKTFMSLIN